MRLEDIELRDLRYFVAVAEELHFGIAAARLSMAQPSLSKSIQRLERRLDVELFHRNTRKVELTNAGHTFLEGARRTIASADRSAREAQMAASGIGGALSISFVGSATYQLLPELLRLFRDKYPSVLLDLHEMSSGAQVQALKSGFTQIGLVRPPIWDESLAQQTFHREPLLVAVLDDHPLAHSAEPIAMSRLASEDLILFRRAITPGFFDSIVDLMHSAGFHPHIVHECTSFATMIALVASGLGITLLPASLVDHAHLMGCVTLPLEDDVAYVEWAMVWNPSQYFEREHVREFVNLTKSVLTPV